MEEVLVHGVFYPPDFVLAAAGLGGVVVHPVRGQEGVVLGLEVRRLDVRGEGGSKGACPAGKYTTTKHKFPVPQKYCLLGLT